MTSKFFLDVKIMFKNIDTIFQIVANDRSDGNWSPIEPEEVADAFKNLEIGGKTILNRSEQ